MICLSTNKLAAQLSTTFINFNNYISPSNNDLKNNFLPTIYYKLVQNGSNYTVSTPLQTVSGQGLDLCNTYQGISTETFTVSVDYKLNLFGSSSPYPSNGVAIFLRNPTTNELVFSTRMQPQKLYVDGLSNQNSLGKLLVGNAYQDGSWYRLIFQITKTGTNKFLLKSNLFLMDATGTNPTNLVALETAEGMNYQFNPTNTVNIEILGGQWGDVSHLDNLSIFGYKNGNKCSTLSTIETGKIKKIDVFPNPTSNYINFISQPKKIEIYSISGQLIESYDHPKEKINIEHLQRGNYIIKFYNDETSMGQKFIKN